MYMANRNGLNDAYSVHTTHDTRHRQRVNHQSRTRSGWVRGTFVERVEPLDEVHGGGGVGNGRREVLKGDLQSSLDLWWLVGRLQHARRVDIVEHLHERGGLLQDVGALLHTSGVSKEDTGVVLMLTPMAVVHHLDDGTR